MLTREQRDKWAEELESVAPVQAAAMRLYSKTKASEECPWEELNETWQSVFMSDARAALRAAVRALPVSDGEP